MCVLSQNLKNIRIQKGWTQQFVAKQVGISQRTLSRAETGSKISNRTLKSLSKIYQVPISKLYTENNYDYVETKEIVTEDQVLKLLFRGGFIKDLEHEILLRYINKVQTDALIMREDIERIIQDTISDKNMYTLVDVVGACLAVNQETLYKVRNVAVN